MNNWLNIQDLAGMMAAETGRKKSDCERFLRTLVEVMREGLIADQEVKVKGLGAFRAVLAEERESVHVNTGNRIVIPARYKFSFSADKELKERVNEPFSMFEATEVDEAMDLSLLVDKKEEKQEEKQEEEITPDQQPLSEGMIEEEIEIESLKEEAVPAPVSVETFNDIEEKYLYYPSKSKKKWWQHLWQTLALLIIILVGLFLYLYIGSSYVSDKEEAVVIIAEEQANLPLEEQQSVVAEESTEEATPFEAPVEEEVKREEPTLPRLLTMQSGIYLTRVAKEVYGNSLFWVYIYEHNKAKIDNPNQIPIGTELEIPAAELYEIDATSQQSLDKAANLQRIIVSKYP